MTYFKYLVVFCLLCSFVLFYFFAFLKKNMMDITDNICMADFVEAAGGHTHREDQKRFYSCHSFYSLNDFAKQLAVHNRRANNLPMRPLRWLSPNEFAVQYV